MLKSRFRIQCANSISRLVPSAPYLAILGFQGSRDYEEHAWKWQRVFSIAEECPAPANVHFIGDRSFYCADTNVAIVGNPAYIPFWKNYGALVCAVTPTRPSAALVQSPVRLWIHGHSGTTNTVHRVVNRIPVVGNTDGCDVWMEFPTMAPQEAEAVAKVDQTPLRTSTYLEDSEVI